MANITGYRHGICIDCQSEKVRDERAYMCQKCFDKAVKELAKND